MSLKINRDSLDARCKARLDVDSGLRNSVMLGQDFDESIVCGTIYGSLLQKYGQ